MAKKILSIVLAITMLTSMLAVAVYAAPNTTTVTVGDGVVDEEGYVILDISYQIPESLDGIGIATTEFVITYDGEHLAPVSQNPEFPDDTKYCMQLTSITQGSYMYANTDSSQTGLEDAIKVAFVDVEGLDESGVWFTVKFKAIGTDSGDFDVDISTISGVDGNIQPVAFETIGGSVTVPKVLTAVTVVTPPSKKQYKIGENLITSGLTVSASYSDGTSTVLTDKDYTLSGFDSVTPGEKTVVVSYGGLSDSFNVTVVKTIISISVKTPPIKTQYKISEQLDTTGLVITATYDDKSTEDITDGYSCSGFDSITPGEKNVIVTYDSEQTTFTVNVVKTLVGIAVKSLPTKTVYNVGDNFDPAGLVVTATYDYGTPEDLTEGFELSGFDSSTPGQKAITVTYNGKTTEFNVTVNAIVLTGISIKTYPLKTQYKIGESLSTNGLELTATYSDGHTETITGGFTTEGFDSSTPGDKIVTVSYGGFNDNFTVTVFKSLQLITVKNMPAKTEYKIGEAFNSNGLVITAIYDYGTPEDLTTGFELSGFDSSTPGEKTITVTYGEKTTEFTVNVVKTLTGISVKIMPAKTEYKIGETFNSNGLVINAAYDNGTFEDLTTGFGLSGFDSSTVGDKLITVTYKDKTTSFTVKVIKSLVGISIINLPTKIEYKIGETFNSNGLVINAAYDDGTFEDLTTGFECSGFNSSTPGEKTITVTYNGKTANFTVNVVKSLTDISIKTMPAKTVYKIGESLNTNGLVVTATYDYGSPEDITEGFECSGFDSATPGEKSVTVTYGDKTTNFTVNVIKSLTGISVKNMPAKTEYKIGEPLDTNGLVITATYDDGTSEDLTEGFECSGFDSSTPGEKSVTVTYGDQTTDFVVNVVKSLTGIIVKTMPAKTEYKIGETFDSTGLVITAIYDDESSEDLTEGFECSGFDSSTPGEKSITVTYGGKTANFTVNVVKTLVGIEVKNLPTKTEYKIGEKFDSTGLVITAIFDDTSRDDLTSGFELSGFDSTTAGEKTITVTYNGKTTEFTVTVVLNALYGDVNLDKIVNATDALMALQFSGGKIQLNDQQKLNGDVDGNGVVNATDALLILQKSAGKRDKFPVEEK